MLPAHTVSPPDVGSYGRRPRMRPRLSTHLENGDGWIREGWLPSPLSRLASSLTSPLLSVHLLPPSLSFLPRRLSLQSTELRVSAYPKIEEHKTRFSDSILSIQYTMVNQFCKWTHSWFLTQILFPGSDPVPRKGSHNTTSDSNKFAFSCRLPIPRYHEPPKSYCWERE